MKIAKMFSHSDLDGVVSNLLMCRYFIDRGYSVSTERCGYDNIDDKILDYINSREYRKESVIIITDISCSYSTAAILDALPNTKILIDHHQSALDNMCVKQKDKPDFKWMYISEDDSATMHVYKFLLKNCAWEDINRIKAYDELVFVTNQWDSKPRDSVDYIRHEGTIMDTLNFFSALGFDKFKARFLINPSIELNEVEACQLDTTERLKNNIVKYINVQKLEYKAEDVTITYGLCFTNTYKSETAEHLTKVNPELAFVFIMDLNTCTGSLRRNGNHLLVDKISCINIAKSFSPEGGGHAFAAGFSFKFEDYNTVITKVMRGDFYI